MSVRPGSKRRQKCKYGAFRLFVTEKSAFRIQQCAIMEVRRAARHESSYRMSRFSVAVVYEHRHEIDISLVDERCLEVSVLPLGKSDCRLRVSVRLDFHAPTHC